MATFVSECCLHALAVAEKAEPFRNVKAVGYLQEIVTPITIDKLLRANEVVTCQIKAAPNTFPAIRVLRTCAAKTVGARSGYRYR